MPIRFERLVDDPIVTLIFEDPLDTVAIQDANAQLAQLLMELGQFYAIVDIREAEITFGEAVALLESPGTPTLASNPRIKFVFLGEPVPHDPTNPGHVPVFSGQDEAIEYILKDIAGHAPGHTAQ